MSLHTIGDTLYTVAKVYKQININFSKVSFLLIKVGKGGQGLNAVDISSPDYMVETPSISYPFPFQRLNTVDMTRDNKFVMADRTRNLADSVVTMLEISATGEAIWGRRYSN
jgi:hypothetical protein